MARAATKFKHAVGKGARENGPPSTAVHQPSPTNLLQVKPVPSGTTRSQHRSSLGTSTAPPGETRMTLLEAARKEPVTFA